MEPELICNTIRVQRSIKKEFSCACVYGGRNPDKKPNLKNSVNPGRRLRKQEITENVITIARLLDLNQIGNNRVEAAVLNRSPGGCPGKGFTLPEDWVKDTEKNRTYPFSKSVEKQEVAP